MTVGVFNQIDPSAHFAGTRIFLLWYRILSLILRARPEGFPVTLSLSRTCDRCAAEVPQAAFCLHCGAKLSSQKMNSLAKMPNTDSKRHENNSVLSDRYHCSDLDEQDRIQTATPKGSKGRQQSAPILVQNVKAAKGRADSTEDSVTPLKHAVSSNAVTKTWLDIDSIRLSDDSSTEVTSQQRHEADAIDDKSLPCINDLLPSPVSDSLPQPPLVTQIVPVPVYLPPVVGTAPVMDAIVDSRPDQDTVGETIPSSPKVKQPDPESVGQADIEPKPVQQENAESSDAKSLANSSGDLAQVLLKVTVVARKALLKNSETTSDKSPRSLEKLTEQLKEAMKKGDLNAVGKAIDRLVKLNHPDVVESLKEAVKNGKKAVRQLAIRSLAGVQHTTAVIQLLKYVNQSSHTASLPAMEALIQCGRAGVLPVVFAAARLSTRHFTSMKQMLLAPDFFYREQWVKFIRSRAFGSDVSPADVALALQLYCVCETTDNDDVENVGDSDRFLKLLDHPDATVRSMAIPQVAKGGKNRHVRRLNAAAKDSSVLVRVAVAEAMLQLRSPKSIRLLLSALDDTEVTVRRAASKSLSEITDEDFADEPLKRLKGETDPETIRHLLQCLTDQQKSKALKFLRPHLAGDSPDLKWQSLLALRDVRHPRLTELIIPLLQDSEARVCEIACQILGNQSSDIAIEQLIKVLASRADVSIRAAAATGLGAAKSTAAVEPLIEATDEGGKVAIASVNALAEIGAVDSQGAISKLLKNTTPEIRCAACRAISQLMGPSAKSDLLLLLDDKDGTVRRTAENCLQKLGSSVGREKVTLLAKKLLATVGGLLVPDAIVSVIPGGTYGFFGLVSVLIAGVMAVSGGLLSVASGPLGSSLPATKIQSVALDDSGTYACVARSRRLLDVWDVTSGQLLGRHELSAGATGVFFNSDSSKALCLSGNQNLSIQLQAGSAEISPADTDLGGVLIGSYQNKGGNHVWLVVNQSGQPVLRKLSENDLSLSAPVALNGALPNGEFAVADNGQLAAARSTQDQIVLWSGAQLAEKSSVDLSDFTGIKSIRFVNHLAINATGDFLAASFGKEVVVLDLKKKKVAGRLFGDVGEVILDLFFHSADKTLIAVTEKGRCLIASSHFADVKVQQVAAVSKKLAQVEVMRSGDVAIGFEDEGKSLQVLDYSKNRLMKQDKDDVLQQQ